jgi:hypothetical protein
MRIEKIELKHSTVELLNKEIIHIHLKAGSNIELSDALLILEAMGKIGDGKKYPVLIDAGEFTSVDKEVRIFSASEASNVYTLADAIAYCNLAQKLLSEFYIKNNHPAVPTKSFSEKEEAITWLKTFVKKV